MDLKIFKIKKKFKKSEHQPDPDFYWKLVLFGTFILIFLAIFFGTRLFWKINKEDFSPAIQYDRQGKKISKNRIDAVLKYFTDRQTKSEGIINSPSPFIDPSM